MAKRRSNTQENGAKPTPEQLKQMGFEDPVVSKGVYKWEEPGQFILGRYKSLKDGTYGKLLMLETEDGVKAVGVPTILATRLESATPGDMLFIEYKGDEVQNSGRTAKEFELRIKPTGKRETLPF